MITQKQKNIGGLLLAIKLRPAGHMDKDGRKIEWAERHQLLVLTFESDRDIRKYSISPDYADDILEGLDSVHWGCLVELELKGKEVVSVTVVSDALADIYESEL